MTEQEEFVAIDRRVRAARGRLAADVQPLGAEYFDKMGEGDFLEWIEERLAMVHGVSRAEPWMHRLTRMARAKQAEAELKRRGITPKPPLRAIV